MKRFRYTVLFLSVIGLVGVRTAEACGCGAYNEASIYCSVQREAGIECTVVRSGSGCGADWTEARVFVDENSAYLACTRP